MTRLLIGQEMRRMDQGAIEQLGIPVAVLMDHAGKAVAKVVCEELRAMTGDREPSSRQIEWSEDAGVSAGGLGQANPVCIVCGKGNNGGDGWVAARWLWHWGFRNLSVLTIVPPDTLDGAAGIAAKSAILHGVPWQPYVPGASLPVADLYVDALLGTGVTRPLEGPIRDLVMLLQDKHIIAVDLPTGIDADTGSVQGTAVHAAVTVAMACEKLGTAVTPGAIHAGRVQVADIGIPVDGAGGWGRTGTADGLGAANGVGKAAGVGAANGVETAEDGWPPAAYVTAESVRSVLPRREALSHKGSFGKVAIAAGDMRGAAQLAAMGAARVGAGLVRVGIDQPDAWVTAPPELVLRSLGGEVSPADWLDGCDAVVLGPGIGSQSAERDWSAHLAGFTGPMVLDAGALTFLLGRCPRPAAGWVMTPHPKECGQLLGCTTAEVQANRVKAAIETARKYDAVVVLKGYRSVIATPTGNIRVNSTGNAALATAGTGDVLAGMIGGLLAQGLSLLDAACVGAYLHGLAGELAGEMHGLASVMASDVVDNISRAIMQVSTISRK